MKTWTPPPTQEAENPFTSGDNERHINKLFIFGAIFGVGLVISIIAGMVIFFRDTAEPLTSVEPPEPAATEPEPEPTEDTPTFTFSPEPEPDEEPAGEEPDPDTNDPADPPTTDDPTEDTSIDTTPADTEPSFEEEAPTDTPIVEDSYSLGNITNPTTPVEVLAVAIRNYTELSTVSADMVTDSITRNAEGLVARHTITTNRGIYSLQGNRQFSTTTSLENQPVEVELPFQLADTEEQYLFDGATLATRHVNGNPLRLDWGILDPATVSQPTNTGLFDYFVTGANYQTVDLGLVLDTILLNPVAVQSITQFDGTFNGETVIELEITFEQSALQASINQVRGEYEQVSELSTLLSAQPLKVWISPTDYHLLGLSQTMVTTSSDGEVTDTINLTVTDRNSTVNLAGMPDANADLTDTDLDGLTDVEEQLLGTDITNTDTDGDGYLDSDEYRAGYNPNGEGTL